MTMQYLNNQKGDINQICLDITFWHDELIRFW